MTEPTSYPPHSRRPGALWAAARADYEAGASLRIVAERHDLNIRTLSRRARDEEWQVPHDPAEKIYQNLMSERCHRPSATMELAAVSLTRDQDDEQLLLAPDTMALCRYAFRRSAESAVMGGPTEALAWARLAQTVARLRDRANVDLSPLNEADYRRVTALVREEGFAFDYAVARAEAEANCGEVSESVPQKFAPSDTLACGNASSHPEIP